MHRKVVLFISVLFSGIVIFLIFWSNSKLDLRSDYEKYLKNEYNRVGALLEDNSSIKDKNVEFPDRAAMQNYYMTVDPALKRVPKERLYKAYRETNEILSKKKKQCTKDAFLWQSTGANMGGRTRTITYDPGTPSGNKVWSGGVTGGLWYNNNITDAGSNWVPVADFWPNLAISCIAFDPANPDVFYVGTGESQTAVNIYRESSGVGVGVWKTTDGGNTWNLLSSTEGFKYINDIKVRSENGQSVIYAAVVSGTYHGIPHQSDPEDGLYRSMDGGISWQQVLPDINGENEPYAPADIEITSGNRIFVGTTKNLEGDGGSVILYSDLGTTGSWTVYDDYVSIIQSDPNYYITDRVILASAPSNPNIVYAIFGAGYLTSSGFNYSKGRYIIRTDNSGTSWIQKSIPDNDPEWATLAWHALTAGVDQNDPNSLYIGGMDVYKSSNGATSWTHVSDWSLMYSGGGDDYVHADQHAQIFKPASSTNALFTSDGGVFYSSSAQSMDPVFQERNSNYNTLQFYTCDIYPVAGQNYFVGGLQDNGTLLYQGSPFDINDMIDGGDGAYCFFDENEPSIMITSYYYNQYTIFMDWNYYQSVGNYSSGVFVNPADYDSDLNILYANAVSFTNSNPNKILRISGIPNNITGTYLNLNTGLNVYFSHVKVSPHSPAGTSTLFIGSQNGRLFKVTNAQATLQKTEIGSSSFPTAYISCVAVGGSEDTLMVTFSNYGVSKIWQTYNGGTTWLNKSGNLPDMPIRWALYHPDNANEAMIATEIGVWHTTNLSSENVLWEPEISGMANVRVDMLQMRESDHTVLAASHGRGLFWTSWEQSSIAPVADFTANNTSIMQGQSVQFTDLSYGNPDAWQWSFEGGLPTTSGEQTPPAVVYNIPGYHTVSLTVSNGSGSNTLTKTEYIFVQPVSTNDLEEDIFSVTYNSNTNSILITAGSSKLSNSVISVFDTGGKVVFSRIIDLEPGKECNIMDHNLRPGLYIINLKDGERNTSIKILAGI